MPVQMIQDIVEKPKKDLRAMIAADRIANPKPVEDQDEEIKEERVAP